MVDQQRTDEVDIIRMAALIGICVVNVPFMALPLETLLSTPAHWYDGAAVFFVESFFQLKFFLLFSFVFGWGVAIQARSAEKKGKSFAQQYLRRMGGLMLLGAAHAILVFSGDILLLYAVLGLLLWQVRTRSPAQLVRIAISMLPLSMICLALLGIVLEVIMSGESQLLANQGAGLGGGFVEATQTRLRDWPTTFAFLLLLQGPLAFGAFVLGLAAAKADFFSPGSRGLQWLEKHLRLLLIMAIPLNIFYAAAVGGVLEDARDMVVLLGFVLIALGAPALSAVYLYLLIRLCRARRMPGWMVRAGRNSLSVYVGQGLLAGFVFGAYGLGFFGELGFAVLLPVAVLIALVNMMLVALYASRFGRGPLEPLLRWLTG